MKLSVLALVVALLGAAASVLMALAPAGVDATLATPANVSIALRDMTRWLGAGTAISALALILETASAGRKPGPTGVE